MANEDIQIFAKAQKEGFARCLPPSMDCDEKPISRWPVPCVCVLGFYEVTVMALRSAHRDAQGRNVI
jgi:hypothetical protein